MHPVLYTKVVCEHFVFVNITGIIHCRCIRCGVHLIKLQHVTELFKRMKGAVTATVVV